MASERQIEANRRNAAKSTGPRTCRGKARSAQNARKDGYTAETIVLSSEEQPVFDRLHQNLTDHYQPITHVEEQFLLEMAWARWRIHRLWSAESAHLERALENACVTQRPNPAMAASVAVADEIGQIDKFSRLEQRLTRSFNQAKANLLEAQQIRRDQEAAEENEANEEKSILEIFGRTHYPGGLDPQLITSPKEPEHSPPTQ